MKRIYTIFVALLLLATATVSVQAQSRQWWEASPTAAESRVLLGHINAVRRVRGFVPLTFSHAGYDYSRWYVNMLATTEEFTHSLVPTWEKSQVLSQMIAHNNELFTTTPTVGWELLHVVDTWAGMPASYVGLMFDHSTTHHGIMFHPKARWAGISHQLSADRKRIYFVVWVGLYE